MKKKMLLICAVLLAFSFKVEASDKGINLYEDICEKVADQYGCCPELIEAMIYYESAGDPRAVSSCGAVGLMQIRPEMNQERCERLGITDLTDPYQNILAGVDHLMELSKRYEVYEALVAYNHGLNSEAMADAREGLSVEYADKVLNKANELEEAHGK